MRVTTLINRLLKFKSFICESVKFGVTDDGVECLELHYRARRNSSPICSRCEMPGSVHSTGKKPRRFWLIPIWKMAVVVVYTMRRVDCATCGTAVVESVPWGTGKETCTKLFQSFLASWGKELPWARVATRFGVSWQAVYRSVKSAVEYGLANRILDNIEAIGVDEIKLKTDRQFMTVVYQLDAGRRRLLWCGEEHKATTLHRFFDEMEKSCMGFSGRIQFVCSDMWKAYLKVISERIPHALHVLDRFHVRKLFSEAIEKTRREEAAKMMRNGDYPVLARSRWALLKRPENLTETQADKLTELLNLNLNTIKVYLLCEQFERFWTYVSPAWAGKFLDSWATEAIDSTIEPIASVASTITTHRELILNWFRARKEISNGVTEGMNLNAKLAIRKARGFRSIDVAKMALYHQLGDLPEPDYGRQFW